MTTLCFSFKSGSIIYEHGPGSRIPPSQQLILSMKQQRNAPHSGWMISGSFKVSESSTDEELVHIVQSLVQQKIDLFGRGLRKLFYSFFPFSSRQALKSVSSPSGYTEEEQLTACSFTLQIDH